MLLKKKFILCVVTVLLLIVSVGCDKSDASDIKSALASSVISSKVSDIKNQDTDDKQQPDNIGPDIPDNSPNEEPPDNSVPDDKKPIKDTENPVKQPDQKNENDMNNQNSNDKKNEDNEFIPPVIQPIDYSKVERRDARLIVNGKDITGDHYVKIIYGISQSTAEILLLAVMEELGADIEPINNNLVKITTHQIRMGIRGEIKVLNEKTVYVLDTSTGVVDYGNPREDFVYDENYLNNRENLGNLFDIAVGGPIYRFRQMVNGEFITDLTAASCIIRIADYFKLDYENNTISIGCYEE